MTFINKIQKWLQIIPRNILVAAFIVLLFIYFAFLIKPTTGYLGVMTAPQNASVTDQPDFGFSPFLMDGENINPQGVRLEIIPLNPKVFLSGVEKILFIIHTIQGDLELSISSEKIKKSFTKKEPIKLSNDEISFVVSDNYLGGNTRYCYVTDPTSEVDAEIITSNFRQNIKKIDIDGSFIIPSIKILFTVSCYTGEVYIHESSSISISQLNVSFNLDSHVIYEWSNKGGDTYRI